MEKERDGGIVDREKMYEKEGKERRDGGREMGESGVWNLTVIRIVGSRRFPLGTSTICKNIGHPVDVVEVLAIFAAKTRRK